MTWFHALRSTAASVKPFLKHRNDWARANPETMQEAKNSVIRFNQVLPDFTTTPSSADIVVFDVETTGFYPFLGDDIISIGAVPIRQPNHQFYELVQTARTIPKSITGLTGIDNEQIKTNGMVFPEMLIKFLRFSQGSFLSAHPASFDVRFLQVLCRRWRLPVLRPYVLDSFHAARLLYPDADASLDGLIQHFHMPVIRRHHALNDAVITAEVLEKLLDQAEVKGCNSIGTLVHESMMKKKRRRR
ncbi:3'-5' exonuclease [Alkalicoccus luteus]|uniref:3'-5' exonuclease n=1 Tax=Alkalicoccus luteus TaxID=1237094 RepID=UPI0040349567